MPRKFEKYRVKDLRTRLGADFFNMVFGDIDLRVADLEDLKVTWEQAVSAITTLGLVRINEALSPAFVEVESKRAAATAALAELQAAIDTFEGDADGEIAAWKTAHLAEIAALIAHIADQANPHAVNKAQVGLSLVANALQLVAENNLSDLTNAATARGNLGLGSVSTLTADADVTLAANSDNRVATQKAVKAYADQLIAATDAMVFKGATDCSASPNYPAADAGHTYRVSVAGKIGGAAGKVVEVGDLYICTQDGTAAGAEAAVGIKWTVVQTNLDGAVIGPAAAVDLRIAIFDGASGKLIKDSGVLLSQLATLAGNAFAGNQNYADYQNSRAMFLDCGWTFVDKGNSGVAAQNLDYTAGSHQKITATGNHTISTSNWPPAGNLGELLLELVNGGSYTITWPTINWIKPDGTVTTSISTYLAANTGRTALQSAGTDFLLLWSRDAGATIYGKLI